MFKGTAESWAVFQRTWWRYAFGTPNGIEPGAGKKHYLARQCTYDEARRIAFDYNQSHDPGPLSRKAEIEKE